MELIKKPRPPLIVDSDTNFINKIKTEAETQSIQPIFATRGKDAQLLIANSKNHFAGIFVNPNITNPHGFSVIRFSHFYRPALPIYIIADESISFKEEELKKLGVQKIIHKPINYSTIAKLITPHSIFFNQGAALEDAKLNKDQIGQEIEVNDSEFTSIYATDYLCGAKSFFDIYVRLNTNHYVKIVQAGDVFDPYRVAHYLQKGVEFFYLRKEAQEGYLTYCDQIASSILKNKKIGIEVKIKQTLNHGQEAMNFLKNHGINENNLEYAKSFVNNVQVLSEKLKLESNNDFVKSFLVDLEMYEHGVSTAMIASLLINPMKIAATHPTKVIGLAALFHDIGLYKMDPLLRDEDVSKMTAQQITLFHTHPIVGSEMLSAIRGIDPVVIQAIAQHHERRNKKGFPLRLGAGYINRVAEIIGICDELCKMIKKLKENPSLNVLAIMEATVFEGFSNPVIEAFRSVFFPEEQTSVSTKAMA
ncbi:MAG: HDIG domain-containing protein [Bdellovibrio sp.]|nr:HDIG domain-containing protein [Bdellovibrio sp.]